MDWLGPVDVHLDRATVFGFEFQDVVARLRSEGDAWRVAVTGPQAAGRGNRAGRSHAAVAPIVLEMQRLQLVDTAAKNGTAATAASGRDEIDPRTLPAITRGRRGFHLAGPALRPA